MTQRTEPYADLDQEQSLRFLDTYRTQACRFGRKFNLINTAYDNERRTMRYTILLHVGLDDGNAASTLAVPAVITLHFDPGSMPKDTSAVSDLVLCMTELAPCTDELFSEITRGAVLPDGMTLSRENVTRVHVECGGLVTNLVASTVIQHDVYPHRPNAVDITSLARGSEESVIDMAMSVLENSGHV